jgi:glucosamine-6-phosphate deaminase
MLNEGNYKNIKLQIVKDKETLAQHFARAMVDAVVKNNALNRPTRLILPVGPTGQYRIFTQLCNQQKIDLSRLHVFAMDEYVGDDGKNLSDDHPFGFSRFLQKNFFSRIDPGCGLNLAQMHIPDAKRTDEYSRMIEAVGGIDICFGGIGINGHIAFNEALDPWEAMSNEEFKRLSTRVIKVAATTKVINAVFGAGGNLRAIPNLAVTIGMKEILAGRKIYIYLDWPWQQQVLRNTLSGPITPMFPAGFLQEHPDVTITVTEDVAREPTIEPE